MRSFGLIDEGVRKMIDFDKLLMERPIITMFFALLAGISAVSTAILPAVIHI
jgi:hypothetical protein